MKDNLLIYSEGAEAPGVLFHTPRLHSLAILPPVRVIAVTDPALRCDPFSLLHLQQVAFQLEIAGQDSFSHREK